MTGHIIPFPADGAERKRLARLRGTSAHAEVLAERERALGLRDQRVATPLAPGQRDAWGNEPLDSPGPLGQYRVRGVWPDRTCRVCGEAATGKHLAAWEYDAHERRLVCQVCFPAVALDALDAIGAKGGAQ